MENSVQMKQSIIISFFIWCHILLSQILNCLISVGSNKKVSHLISIVTFVYWNGSCQALLHTLSQTQVTKSCHILSPRCHTFKISIIYFKCHLESFQFMSHISTCHTYCHMSHIVTCHTLSLVTCHTLSHFVTFAKKRSQNLARFLWHFLSQFSLLSH